MEFCLPYGSLSSVEDADEVQLEVNSNSNNDSSSAVRKGDSSITEDIIAAAQRLQQQQYTRMEQWPSLSRCRQRKSTHAV